MDNQLFEDLNYDPLTGVFTLKKTTRCRLKKGMVAGSLHTKKGYRQISIRGTMYLAHRLAWLFVYGEWPKTLLDHKDGDKDNNAIGNLRKATSQDNQHNRKRAQKGSTIGLIGVSRSGKKYSAKITLSGVSEHIGTFTTKKEAYDAYIKRKKEIHPAFIEGKYPEIIEDPPEETKTKYCKRGHERTPGNISNAGKCKKCLEIIKKEWTTANKDRIRDVNKKYREVHKEEKRAKDKAWAEQNPEKVKEKKRRYREKLRA